MKKICLLFLAISFNLANGLVIKNQAKKTIVVITNYSNEQFYRAHELKPSMLNSQPSIKANIANLVEIQIYDKIPTNYNTGKQIDIKQIESLNDTYQNVYKKIPKNEPAELSSPIVEIDKNDLTDSEYAIMPSPQGKLTFVEVASNIKS
ncbi:MAG: hypothetical protein ABIA74_03795 [bacterium]